MIKATIVLLTKNAEKHIDEILKEIFRQECTYEFEVLVIDSGSTDKTLSALAKYPIRLLTIEPELFNHGDTRNLGAEEACSDSEFIIFLSQDATPYNEEWLQNLLNPFSESPDISGVYSHHIPRPDAKASVVRQLVTYTQTGGENRLVKKPTSIEDYESKRFFYNFFSNTSSAIRRSTWRQFPFEHTDFAEDALWADTVIRNGLTIIYEPASMVIHSHDYSLIEQFRQNVDYAYSMNRLFEPASYRNQMFWLKQFLSIPIQLYRDCRFVLHSPFFSSRSLWDKVSMMALSVPWQLATITGAWVGANLDHIPDWLKLLISRQERIKRRQ